LALDFVVLWIGARERLGEKTADTVVTPARLQQRGGLALAGAPAAVRLILLGVLLATAAGPASGEDLGAGFLSLLSTVPEAAPTYSASPMFGFLDLRALEEAAALQHPAATSQFDDWPEAERARWIAAFRRAQSNNELLSLSSASRGRMPQAVGFDWFDIDRVLSFWGPPDTVTVVAGSRLPDLARLEAALIPRSSLGG
jgi:hypothetical protein